MAPGVQRLRQGRLNDEFLIQGNVDVLLLSPDKAVVARDGHIAEPGVALGYVALVHAYFSKKPLPLLDGNNLASEVLPQLTLVSPWTSPISLSSSFTSLSFFSSSSSSSHPVKAVAFLMLG